MNDTDSAAKVDKMVSMLLSGEKPLEVRANLLLGILQSGDPAMLAIAKGLLGKMESAAPAAELDELKSRLQQALAELEQGGVRPSTFIGKADGELPGPKPRAQVVTPDGQLRFPFLREGVKLDDLRPGMTAYLDAKGAVILGFSQMIPTVGPQAQFVRQLPDTEQIEVSVRDEVVTLYASSAILDAVGDGELKRGDKRVGLSASAICLSQDPRRHRSSSPLCRSQSLAQCSSGQGHWQPAPLLGLALSPHACAAVSRRFAAAV